MVAYIVKLEDGVWLVDCIGDVRRTLVEANAKQFVKFTQARAALTAARDFRPFENARIVAIQASV